MRICIYGAGSLGSLVGGLLGHHGHDVTLVGRESHVAAVRESGLRVVTPDDAFTVDVGATTDVHDCEGADLAIVTVKAFDTAAAARDLADCDLDAVCSFQNGMGNEATLAAHLDCPVYAGTVTYGAVLREAGTVECTGVGEVVFGPHEGGEGPLDAALETAFTDGGLVAELTADMPRRLWQKLAVNAGINTVTALADVDNGDLLSGEAHELATTAARETARVARGHDVSLSNRTAVAAVESVATATAMNTSSMRQDVHDGKRTEVDAITGYVVEQADEIPDAHVSVPVCETVTRLLRAWEDGRGLRPA
ncbi:ketopantoate reductase family protein [Haloarchaeobius amylolyticus]|uniref:ketopantoate reductase family protein n=1 Tax=Haloarchaeobius amylolyticus TaxID=1198296 RepID=UPI00226E9F38|nr:2-dehydropantoate 2-reductase [Haloarchaeobius amylolyticus]